MLELLSQKAYLVRIKSISGPVAMANIWETFCLCVHYTGVDAFFFTTNILACDTLPFFKSV